MCVREQHIHVHVVPAQQQLGVVLALQVLVDEVGQQVFEDVSGVLQLALQHGHDERGHVAAVSHGESSLRLQRTDEAQQEHLVVDQLAEKLQTLFHLLLSVTRHLLQKGFKCNTCSRCM